MDVITKEAVEVLEEENEQLKEQIEELQSTVDVLKGILEHARDLSYDLWQEMRTVGA